jgi:hypothetical protein
MDFNQFQAFMRAAAKKVNAMTAPSQGSSPSQRRSTRETWLSLLTSHLLPLAAQLGETYVGAASTSSDKRQDKSNGDTLAQDWTTIHSPSFQNMLRREAPALRLMFRSFKTSSTASMKFDEFSNCARICRVIPQLLEARQLHSLYAFVADQSPVIDYDAFGYLVLLMGVAVQRRQFTADLSVGDGVDIFLQHIIATLKQKLKQR